jgi:hypothetical protein
VPRLPTRLRMPSIALEPLPGDVAGLLDMRSTAIALLVALCGVTASQPCVAADREPSQPRWVIKATVLNRHTGRSVERRELNGSVLEFDDQAACQSVLELIGPIVNSDFSILLRCEKSGAHKVKL